MSRTLVIGDIHGGLKALIQLFEKVQVSTNDTLIFLGDYVDGWSDSAATVSFLIELQTTHHCIFLRGNHDELCYQWLAKGKNNPEWLKHGGQATLDGYSQLSEEEKKSHIAFYEAMHNYVVYKDCLFLHAGFTNIKGPEHEYFSKTFYWDRTLWETALATSKDLDKDHLYYPKRLTLFKEIYIGHTPVTRINKMTPINAHSVWNIDTGAAFKGPLTMLDIVTKEYWQSTPVWELYPDEKGRN